MKKTGMKSVLRSVAIVLSAIMFLGALAVASFAEDAVAEVRYKIGESGVWTDGAFADAIANANGNTAVIELQKDVTVTGGVSITGGSITVKSYSDGDKIYSIKRGSAFTSSVFSVSGGTLTFADVTLDGQGYTPKVNGGMISMTAGTVNLNAGTTIQNSSVHSTDNKGGAIYATAGTINMSEGTTIKDCSARRGGALSLSGDALVFNMTGGLITGCEAIGDWSNGAAVYMEKNPEFNMSGGVITGNTSYRTGGASEQQVNSFIDGAVAALSSTSYTGNRVNLSKNAVIWNNMAYKVYQNDAGKRVATDDVVVGGDIVFTVGCHYNTVVNVAADFCGLVGFASNSLLSGSGKGVGTAGEGLSEGDVIIGLVETSRTGANVVCVNSSGILEWKAASSEARYQVGSDEWKTGTFAQAIAAAVEAGNTVQTTVLLQKDVTLTAGVSITAGNITVKSYSKDIGIYSIKRGSEFKASAITVSGGTLTLENVTLDGQGDSYVPWWDGGMISMTAGTVNLKDGTTIQNSKVNGERTGGAIRATAGTLNMSEGVTIKNCKGRKGGAIALSGEVTFNMTGGLITNCVAVNNSSSTDAYASGAAIYMEKNATFNMSGGVITENTSYRSGNAKNHANGNFIDGAVAAMPGHSSSANNKVYLSKNAVIWNNTAYKYDETTGTYDFSVGGDLVFTIDNHVNEVVNVKTDFCGLVGFASNTMTLSKNNAGTTPYVGIVAEDSLGNAWNTGDVIVGLVDTTGNRVAIVRADGYLEWTDAVVAAYADDGLPRRYASLAAAYDAVGGKNPIELLKDVMGTDIFTKTGMTAKLILNGHAVNVSDGIEYETGVAKETVGAFTYGSYTYAGKEAEVTTYTVTRVDHICAPGAATAGAPSVCQECGIIYGFPTDESLNVRYSTDAGDSWTYASFGAAITAIGTDAATIELYRDVTLTAGVAVSSNLTIRSLPFELNGVKPGAIYSIKRGSAFTSSVFTVSGGTLTFENITLDGQGGTYMPKAHGGMISMTAGTVNLNVGTTIQNSSVHTTNHMGGAIYATAGTMINMSEGATIKNCSSRKGGALSLTSAKFTMKGGLITGCQAIGEYSNGAAIYMSGGSTFTMEGGVIAGNTAHRTFLMPNSNGGIYQEVDSFIDGAIGYVNKTNTITLKGDATIRNNYGYKYDGTSPALTLGADIVPCVDNRGPKEIHIDAGFTGSVGIAYPTTGQIGVMDGEFTGILGTVIDANSGKVAKAADGILKWTAAEAEIDTNGKLTRYEKLQDAYVAVGSQTPIKLLANATLTLAEVGDTAKIAENGYMLTVVSSNGGFEKSASVKVTVDGYTFADCGYTLPSYTLSVITYTAIEGGAVTSVQLASGTDLTLYFYANLVDKFKDSSTLVVTRTGDTEADSETQTLTPEFDEEMGLYRFTYTGIAPQYAGDPIKIELICNGKTSFTRENYSVEEYCRKALAMDAASLDLTVEKCGELHTNLRDLLAYCASAQTYLGYNTDELVNEGIKGSEFVLPASTPKQVIVNNDTVKDATFTQAGVRFDNANNIFFEFTTTDTASTKVVIGNKTHTEFTAVAGKTNTYRVYTDDLLATQFDVVYTAKLYFGDTLLQTCKYSVGAYAYSLATSDDYTEAEKNLAMATYNYGVASRIWMDSYSKATAASSVAGLNMLGGASLDGSALAMNNDASGIEFAYRGKGDIVLNLTAEADSRIEITVDGATVNHFLVKAGTADYTVFKGLDDGKHTVRIVKENGSDLALNSIFVKGYFTKVDTEDSMYIEFIGSDMLLGKNIFLNYDSYEDDVTGAYAVLAARELGAKYLISDTFVASATAPNLVVIEYKNGESYTELLASIREAYGEVSILFVGDDVMSEVLGEAYCQLTADATGIDGYPSAGGAAIQGAELAKYIRDNFFEEMIESASDDIIVVVDAAANGYNSFHVYVKTSDPSGKYYIRYNFVHEYETTYDNFGTTSAPTGISNFRIRAAECVEVTSIDENSVTCTKLYNVLQDGEISAALKTMSKNNGASASTDFTGGFHGDEWILGTDGKAGNIGDAGWTPDVTLLADGEPITIVGGEAQVITCNTLTFDQTSMMYEWGTGSATPENEVAKRGEPLLVHTQHFTITREGGIHNRQSFEWKKDIKIATSSNYLLMFTMYRYVNQKDVCTDVELFNVDGVSFGKASASGTVSKEYSVLQDETNRYALYSGKTSGVSAYAGYDLCHVGEFENNSATLSDMKVNIRASQGDNKLYARFVSTNEDPSQINANDFWTVDVAYGIDYVNPNN